MAERRRALVLLLAAVLLAPAAALAEPGAERKQELLRLLRHDCGSCHGMRLTGGLGPALTPAALQPKPAAALAAIILHGVPGTPMPPWQGLLAGEEADWLARTLKEGLAR